MALGPNTRSTYLLGDLDLPVPLLPHTCNGDSNSVTAVTVKMTCGNASEPSENIGFYGCK